MIKIKKGYFLRNVLNVYVVMGSGKEAYAPNCIMSVNETGAFLWKLLEEGADISVLAEKLTEEYEVASEDAVRDVEKFLEQLKEKELIEE